MTLNDAMGLADTAARLQTMQPKPHSPSVRRSASQDLAAKPGPGNGKAACHFGSSKDHREILSGSSAMLRDNDAMQGSSFKMAAWRKNDWVELRVENR